MITVNQKDLFHRGTVNNEIVEKFAHFNSLETSDPTLKKVLVDIQSLLRCEENLCMVSRDLAEFLARYYGNFDDPKISFGLETRAILTHCVMYYRACFVTGNKNKKPFWFLDKESVENEIHLKIRLLGDKLIGHFDFDSLARKDIAKWRIEVCPDGLNPVEANLRFDKVFSLHRAEIIEWQCHIAYLLNEIEKKIKEMNLIINNNLKIV